MRRYHFSTITGTTAMLLPETEGRAMSALLRYLLIPLDVGVTSHLKILSSSGNLSRAATSSASREDGQGWSSGSSDYACKSHSAQVSRIVVDVK